MKTGTVLLFLFSFAVLQSCSVNQEKGELVFSQDFESADLGTCTVSNLNLMWAGSADGFSGVASNRVSIVTDAVQGQVLRVLYPSNQYESAQSGAQWKFYLNKTYQELYCTYKVKFQNGFDFVKGGKIPGLAGGTANSGKRPSTGFDGFSARMMWREEGSAIQYVYHPGQIADTGDVMYWTVNSQYVKFIPGQWHQVEHRIVMNTPGFFDGIIECWFDGIRAFYVDNISFRYTNAYGIDIFYFSTFFGGDKADWASSKDQYAYFDDFIISTKR